MKLMIPLMFLGNSLEAAQQAVDILSMEHKDLCGSYAWDKVISARNQLEIAILYLKARDTVENKNRIESHA